MTTTCQEKTTCGYIVSVRVAEPQGRSEKPYLSLAVTADVVVRTKIQSMFMLISSRPLLFRRLHFKLYLKLTHYRKRSIFV